MARPTSSPGAVPPESDDTIDWVRFLWQERIDEPPEVFLAMSSVMRLHALMTSTMDRALKPHRLNRTSFMYLMTLLLSERGWRSLRGLSDSLLVSPASVTQLTDQLERRGLVRRKPHPTDRRVTSCRLTAKGRAAAEAARASLAEISYGLVGLEEVAAARTVEQLGLLRSELEGRVRARTGGEPAVGERTA
jgi:DNA-binding MarR family transcriptional regulator